MGALIENRAQEYKATVGHRGINTKLPLDIVVEIQSNFAVCYLACSSLTCKLNNGATCLFLSFHC